jgi:DNA-binding IclR family transcriptional regulator
VTTLRHEQQLDGILVEPPFPEVVGAQLLVRALKLLFHLREREEPVTVAELASTLRIAPSNVYRLVQTLELSGLVERAGGGVRLGLRFLDLSRAVDRRLQDELVPAASPVMRALTQETDETSLLTMPTGLHAIAVLSVESTKPVRLSFATGRLFPLYAAASGKVLLPFVSARLREHVLAEREGWQLASGARLSVAELREQIDRIRDDGYCVTFGEVDADAAGVAAPILTENGRLLGGLSLAGPASRFVDRLDALVDQVRAAAAEIGRRLENGRV